MEQQINKQPKAVRNVLKVIRFIFDVLTLFSSRWLKKN